MKTFIALLTITLAFAAACKMRTTKSESAQNGPSEQDAAAPPSSNAASSRNYVRCYVECHSMRTNINTGESIRLCHVSVDYAETEESACERAREFCVNEMCTTDSLIYRFTGCRPGRRLYLHYIPLHGCEEN